MSTTTVREFVSHHGGTVLLLLLFAGSLGLNVYQALGAHQPKDHPSASPQIGKKLQPVSVRTIDGDSLRLQFSESRPAVVYFLSPSCSWCNRNYANIAALGTAAAANYRFVGLARDVDRAALSAYLKDRPLPFQVYLVGDNNWLDANSLFGTPATLVLNSEGAVTHAWLGALSSNHQEEAEKLFGVRLPGLTNQ